MAKYHYRNPGFGVDDVMPQPMVLPGSDSAETVYDYGARYNWSGGLGGSGYRSPQSGSSADPFDPYFDQERIRLSERARLRQAIDPEDGFTGFLHHGYDQVKGSIVDAARAGDRQRVDEGLQILRAFRDQYRKDLTRWALDGATGGPRAAAMAGNAEELLTDGFLRMPIATGYDGKGDPVRSVPLQMYLDSGLNTAPDTATDFLRSRFPEILAKIDNAAQLGDVTMVKELAKTVDDYYVNNQTAVSRLLSYSDAVSSAFGPELIAAARSMASGRWKAQSVPFKVGPDGKAEQSFTIGELLSGMPDALKDRAATTMAERYKINVDQAAAAVDPAAKYHDLFAPMVSNITTGVASQAAARAADPEAARRTERAGTELKAVSRHFAKNKDYWDGVDDDGGHATEFYHAVVEGFGPSLTDKQMDMVFKKYQSRTASGDDVDTRSYVLDFAGAVKAAVPMGRRLEADPSNPESTKVVETQKPLVRPDKVQHDYLGVVKKLDDIGATPDFDQCSASLKNNLEKAYAIENYAGVSFRELGLGNAVVDQTSYDLSSGRSELLGARHEGRALADMETACNVLVTKTGSTKSGLADLGVNLPVAVRSANAAVLKAYGKERAGGDVSFQDFLAGAADINSQVVDSVADAFATSFGIARGNAGVRLIARQYLTSLAEEDGTTLTQILKKNMGLLEERTTPEGEKQLVPTTPREYADPSNGKLTRDAPSASASELGMYSTVPSKYNGVTGAARGRAERELNDMAEGKSPVTGGSDEASMAARGLAKGILDIQMQQHREGDSEEDRKDTSALAGDAGRVMFDNMEVFVKRTDGENFQPGQEAAGIWNFVKSGDLIRYLEGHDKDWAPDVGWGEDHLNGSAAHFVGQALEQLGRWRDDRTMDAHAGEARMLIALISEVYPALANRGMAIDYILEHGGSPGSSRDMVFRRLQDAGLVHFTRFRNDMMSVEGWRYAFGSGGVTDIDDHRINAARDWTMTRLSNYFGVDVNQFTWMPEVGYERAPREGVRWTHADYGGILKIYDHNHRTDPKLYLGTSEGRPGGTSDEKQNASSEAGDAAEWAGPQGLRAVLDEAVSPAQAAANVSQWVMSSLVPADERVAQLEKTFLSRAYMQFPGDLEGAEKYVKTYTPLIQALRDDLQQQYPEDWDSRLRKIVEQQMSKDIVHVPVAIKDPATGQRTGVRYVSQAVPHGEAIAHGGRTSDGTMSLALYYARQVDDLEAMRQQRIIQLEGGREERRQAAKHRDD